jgi:hypothetical protein
VFKCAGQGVQMGAKYALNKNSFLKYFGGMNKGRPNADDLNRAREFADNLQFYLEGE